MAKGYEGKHNVLGPNDSVSLTQTQLDEYIKCAQDPLYFTNNYVKIRSVDGGELLTFKLRSYQTKMMESFHRERNTISLCPRQSGKTETVVAYILHFAMFNKNMMCVILTNKEKLALDIVGRIRVAYENLPSWLKQSVATYNKGDIEFTNGSRIVSSATSIDSARGFPISLLYLDEFAHLDPNMADEFYTSTYPTVSSGKNTKILISSTPKGMNLFYKLWSDAVKKENSFNPIQVDWHEVPGRDEAWKQRMIKDIGEQKFDQEFACEFLGSSNTLISGKKLRAMVWSKPKSLEDYGRAGKYAMYTDPVCEVKQGGRVVQAGRTYLMSVDVSRGQGLDYHAFQVIDITEIPYRVVASYRHNTLSHLVFPTAVVSAARYWNDAFILVEISDNGQQIADIIHYDLEYENLVKIQTRGKKGQEVIDSGAPTKTSLGLKTSVLTKKIGCTNLKAMIEADKLIVEDDDTVMEFFTFISVKNSYEADAGKNDDLVMPLVNASWLLRQDFFRDMTEGDLRKMLVKEQAFDEELLMPMPVLGEEKNERFIDSGLLWESVPLAEFSLGHGTSTQNDWENWRRGY